MPADDRRDDAVLQAGGSPPLRYPDLGAEVAVGVLPPGWAERLPELYHSSFSTAEFFPTFTRCPTFNACRLERPEHVIVFTVDGHAATVLNRLFPIEPEDAGRLVDAVTRSFKGVDRVLMQLGDAPGDLGHPFLVRNRLSDVTIPLPSGSTSSLDLLGSSTRKNVRKYRRRLERDHPDHEFVVVRGEAIDADLLETSLDLVRRRMRASGRVPQVSDDRAARLLPFAHKWGLVCALLIDGAVVAADFCSRVGRGMFDHHGSFDTDYSYYRLGWLSRLHAVDEAITLGCREFHLLWGEPDYKFRLGGVARPLYDVTIYRSRATRLAAVRDWGAVASQRTSDRWRSGLTSVRSAAGKARRGLRQTERD